MTTKVSIHSLDLTPLECEVLSELMAAKLEQHLADRARYLSPEAERLAKAAAMTQALERRDPTCLDCEPGRPCATHRRGCENCGYTAEEGAVLHAGTVSASKRGPGVTPVVELWCDECDPPSSVGGKYSDGQPDPWDLSDEELVPTCPLPRGGPQSYRDRREWDEHDDVSDINPWEKTTK